MNPYFVPIPRRARIATAVSLALFQLASQAQAQTATDPAQPAAAPQAVVVTGSLIRRVADEGTTPVTTVKAQELEARGHTELKDFVLEQPEHAIYLSVTQLAERTGTSEATVVRFCRKVGFRGYQHLRIALACSLSPPTAPAAAGDEIQSLCRQSLEQAVQALGSTLEAIDTATLRQAAERAAAARRLEVYGVGSSGLVAQIAAYKFTRIGKPAVAYVDPHLQAVSASLLEQGDVAIGISYSGATADTVHSLGVAKQAGATTICLTNYDRSPITRVSDLVILTAARENPLRSGDTPAIAAQLFAVGLLIAVTEQLLGERAAQALQRTSESVLAKKL